MMTLDSGLLFWATL